MAVPSVVWIAAIIVLAAALIASNKSVVNEKLAELLWKKGEAMECKFSIKRAHIPLRLHAIICSWG